jgi:cholestenol delta-isomerase
LALISATFFKLKPKLKLNSDEEFSHVWFVTNGSIIHIFLDGMIGFFRLSTPLYSAYCLLDKRFNERNSVVLLVCLLEIFVMGPLCLYVGRKFADGTDVIFRDVLVIIVSVLQIMGTIFFVAHEILRHFRDVCSEEGCFTFSTGNLFFFWGLFVVANIIWIVVPLHQIDLANERICANYSK